MNSTEIQKYLKYPSLLSETTLPLLAELVQEYPWFQTGWVLYLKNLKNLECPEYQSVLNQVALRVANRKWLNGFIEGWHQPVKNEENTGEPSLVIADYPVGESEPGQYPGSDKSKLIESFLAKGATFKAPSPDEPNIPGIDLAEKAVAISDEIVTEKFANLLLRQLKYKEAIESFEKLSLKFPEKSIYFAARIEEVKSLLKH